MRAWLAALILALAPSVAEAASCTDGTNCFCDTAVVTGDARRLLCEDFEILTLWDARGVAGAPATGPSGCSVGANPLTANCANATSPTWGPWYDKGAETVRGKNSYWRQTYGSASGSMDWTDGAPASPTYGVSCPGGATCYQGEYRADDAWQANSFAGIDIIRDASNEWDDEEATDLAPLRPDGSRGGYGNQTFAHRLKKAAANITDIAGRKDWGAVQEIGVTMLVAYSTGIESSEIWGDAWKHDEWGPTDNALFLMDNNSGTGLNCNEAGASPFCTSIWINGGTSACTAALANAAWSGRKGQFDCSNPATFRFYADQTAYTRATRWPNLNKWACVRMHIRGIAASGHTLGMTKTVDFGDGVDRTIVDFDGFDNAVTIDGANLMRALAWNGYSNYKNTHAITKAARRYEDNFYVRGGTTAQCAGNACVPISCTDAGFYEGGSAPVVPSIHLSVPTLSPSVTVGGTATSQTFTVNNAGGGTLSYAITEGLAWLSISPSSGTSTGEADTVTVTYSTSSLAVGSYSGKITVTDAAASNSPQEVTVTLTVNASPPTIGVSKATLTPMVVAGSNATADTFSVSNQGGSTLSYAVSDNASWLSVSPTPSSAAAGSSTAETVTYSTAGLAAGSYSGTITVTDSGSSPAATNSPQTIAVSLTVAAAPPPPTAPLLVPGNHVGNSWSKSW